MSEKTKVWFLLLSSAMVGVLIGNFISFSIECFVLPKPKQHLCECELCKTKRQLETCEVLDSIFTSKIEIEVNKK